MELCRIVVPTDPATLSPNAAKKLKLREQMILKRKAWMDSRNCWIAAGRPKAAGKVIVHFIVRRARLMDEGNLIAGLKHQMDGLFVNAITKDDGPGYVKLGHIEQVIKPEYHRKPEVEFIVESL